MKIPDLLTQPVSEGDTIQLKVHADLGFTETSETAMIYTPGAPTVTYTCTGVTLDFHCKYSPDSEFTFADEVDAYYQIFSKIFE